MEGGHVCECDPGYERREQSCELKGMWTVIMMWAVIMMRTLIMMPMTFNHDANDSNHDAKCE